MTDLRPSTTAGWDSAGWDSDFRRQIEDDAHEQAEIDLRRQFRVMTTWPLIKAVIRLNIGWFLLGLAWALVERYTTPTTKARFDAFWPSLSNDLDVANEGIEDSRRIYDGRRSDS